MRAAIYFPSFGDGGAERMLVNLAGGMAGCGMEVDFVIRRPDAPYLDALPVAVHRVVTGDGPPARALARYLAERRPEAVIAGKDRALEELVTLRRRCGGDFRIVARPGTNLSARLARRGRIQRWRTLRRLRRAYAGADLVIANSWGVARDMAHITGMDPCRIPVVRNPVITPALTALAAAPCAHPWPGDGGPPVIVGMGGLRHQKGFDVLVEAFAELVRRRPARLVIFGRGRLRERLLALARRRGVGELVDLAGFAGNPYACLARADLFVLSSNWEGSPNALTEALALGVPAVATDCPSGPREIMAGGRVGPLVPVGDAAALAAAMAAVLDRPPERAALTGAVAEYHQAGAAMKYRLLLAAACEGAGR